MINVINNKKTKPAAPDAQASVAKEPLAPDAQASVAKEPLAPDAQASVAKGPLAPDAQASVAKGPSYILSDKRLFECIKGGDGKSIERHVSEGGSLEGSYNGTSLKDYARMYNHGSITSFFDLP